MDWVYFVLVLSLGTQSTAGKKQTFTNEGSVRDGDRTASSDEPLRQLVESLIVRIERHENRLRQMEKTMEENIEHLQHKDIRIGHLEQELDEIKTLSHQTQSPIDKRQQSGGLDIKPEAQDHGISPEAQDHGISPEAQDHGISPEAQDHGISPEAQDHGISPEDQDHGISPEDQGHGIKPEAQDHGISPEDQDHDSKPEAQDHGISPEGQDQGIKSEDQDHGINYADQEQDIRPDSSKEQHKSNTDGITCMQKRQDELSHRTSRVSPNSGKIGAFSVSLSKGLALHPGSIVKFDEVLLDIGDNYNKVDGVYTVPVSGVYVFTWTMTAYGQDDVVTQLIVNGSQRGTIFADPDNSHWDSTTGLIVTEASAGDHVFIRSKYSGFLQSHIDHSKTMFSGWRLK